MPNNPNIGKEGIPYQFSKTNQPQGAGRKPSQLKKFIKDNNISSLDISNMIKYLAPMNEEKWTEIFTDTKKPMLLRLFASAFLKDFTRGDLQNTMQLINRAFGPPPQHLDHTHEIRFDDMSDEELDARIKALLNKVIE